MYNNPGKKIKTVAIVLCIAEIIGNLSAAIGVYRLVMNLTSTFYSDGEAGLAALAAIVVFCVLCVLTWVSYLLVMGFGELVENSTKLVKLVDESSIMSPTALRSAPDLPAKETPSGFTAPTFSSSLKRICPKCKTENEKDSMFCGVCGQRLN